MELAKEGKAEEVEIVIMLSMSEEELTKDIAVLDKDIQDMTVTLKKMKTLYNEISEEAKKEVVWLHILVVVCIELSEFTIIM